MKVSTSGFYAWRSCPVTDRAWADAQLTNTIFDIHVMSRRSYGSPRVPGSREFVDRVAVSEPAFEDSVQ